MTDSNASIERQAALTKWITSLPKELELKPDTLSSASSDASFRRYFRLKAGSSTLIVMDAPPPHEDCTPFIQMTKRLEQASVQVPSILASDPGQGFLLLTDLGHHTYYDRIQAGIDDPSLQRLYRGALEALVALQSASTDGLGAMSSTRLTEELELFEQWYVQRHHQTTLSNAESDMLQGVFAALTEAMTAEPQVLVHRDFHSPNLMDCEAIDGLQTPGVIDYQDALIGPISYDIASLVFDARTTWPEAQQLDWAIRFWEKARAHGLPVPADFAVFHQHYEYSSLQRNLRILGVFARLNHRDGKSHYLAHIPRVLQYVRQVASRYRPFVPLMRLLDRLDGISTEVKLTF